ncbi:hypothetical protein [Sphingomonas sp.]|uniref:hypothetical protein n=1 Tax=Sphingomonas sp. TaxID=28214 RepID=UPI0035C816BF
MNVRRSGAWQDLTGAALLAALLCAVWAVRDWAALSALHLPDTDDAVRLQQIRDWLGGQRVGDLAQHRLGSPPGLEMHWSRLPDLMPGVIIALLTGTFGRHGAELAAVVIWPALLFAAALWLIARIARQVGAPPGIALVLAGLAYPATSVFLPGRIDHHGLQMVLVLALMHRLLAPATLASGAVAGLAVATSLAIGLETAPLLAVAGGVLVTDWVRGDRVRMLGFGATLVAALLLSGALLRTGGWDYPACDGFDRQLWRAGTIAALAPLVLGLIGDRMRGRWRVIVAAMVCGAAVVVALAASPACLQPYGAVDPLLARAWLAQVGEAQPLFGASLAQAIGYAGLMLVGIAVGTVLAWRTGGRGWTILLAFQFAALAVTLVQLRGAYAGALLAVPALAATIAAARRRGTLALVAAWVASAGILYPILGKALPSRPEEGGVAQAPCEKQVMLAHLATLPPGWLLASIDLGAYALAETPHRVIAAPYHRNTTGNLALLTVVQAPLPEAARVTREWQVDYLALCPADLGTGANTLGAAIRAGRAPAWLVPVAPHLYRVRRP